MGRRSKAGDSIGGLPATGIAVYVADISPPQNPNVTRTQRRDTHKPQKGRAVGKTETQPEGSLTTAATTAGLGQPSLWSRDTVARNRTASPIYGEV